MGPKVIPSLGGVPLLLLINLFLLFGFQTKFWNSNPGIVLQ